MPSLGCSGSRVASMVNCSPSWGAGKGGHLSKCTSCFYKWKKAGSSSYSCCFSISFSSKQPLWQRNILGHDKGFRGPENRNMPRHLWEVTSTCISRARREVRHSGQRALQSWGLCSSNPEIFHQLINRCLGGCQAFFLVSVLFYFTSISFSITFDIQYYFILVSGVQLSG